MNKNITKAVLTSALFFSMASPSLLFAQQRSNSTQEDHPHQAIKRPMPGRPERQQSKNAQHKRAEKSQKMQHHGFLGIYSSEWQSLSVENQRKLKISAIELGLTDRPKMNREASQKMSPQERMEYFNSAQAQAARQERMNQMQKFWQEAAKLNVGPLSAERKAKTIEKLDRQQERINQQRALLQ